MPKEVQLLLGKFIFCPIGGKEFILSELIQNIFQVFCMFFSSLWIHQDIIDIDDNGLVQLFMEDGIHEGYEN
jgi:hypothetical protein